MITINEFTLVTMVISTTNGTEHVPALKHRSGLCIQSAIGELDLYIISHYASGMTLGVSANALSDAIEILDAMLGATQLHWWTSTPLRALSPEERRAAKTALLDAAAATGKAVVFQRVAEVQP